MANNGKEKASRSAVNSPTNALTSNQAQFTALKRIRQRCRRLIDRFDRMERKENNNGREVHANENSGGFRIGGLVERGPLRRFGLGGVTHWVDHDDENQWDDEEHPRSGRRPYGRMQVGGRQRDLDHYSRVYEVARDDMVITTCIYLNGKVNSWWRWLMAHYAEDGGPLKWTMFEREFLN
ncbi:hypothetical protein ACOSP7_018831 [Xanthoceras sorbifolium]